MSDLPDGLTEEDLKNGIVRFSMDQPAGGDVEVGNTVSGEVTDTDYRSHEAGGETFYYYQIDVQIDDAFEISASASLNGGKLNQGTALGYMTTRFLDDPEELHEEDLDMDETYQGERVEFEVDESEEGFTEVAEDVDGIPTLRPEGSEIDAEIEYEAMSGGSNDSSDSSDGDSDDADDSDSSGVKVNEQFETLVFEHIGEDEGELKKALAKEGSQFVKKYKEVLDDGLVEVEDGEITDADL